MVNALGRMYTPRERGFWEAASVPAAAARAGRAARNGRNLRRLGFVHRDSLPSGSVGDNRAAASARGAPRARRPAHGVAYGPCRSHLVAIHLWPRSTGMPACRQRESIWPRAFAYSKYTALPATRPHRQLELGEVGVAALLRLAQVHHHRRDPLAAVLELACRPLEGRIEEVVVRLVTRRPPDSGAAAAARRAAHRDARSAPRRAPRSARRPRSRRSRSARPRCGARR